MSERIVILEDDPGLRSALERFVQRRGLETEAVGTVSEALELLGSGSADLLVSDIRLPDGSGLELIQHLQAEGMGIPSILITGLPDMALAAEGMKAGALDFLTKPMDLEKLGDVLDRAITQIRHRRRSTSTAGRRDRTPEPPGPPRLVGRHPSIVEIFKKIGRAAASSAPVLIRGESGTGKELVAREIHRHSRSGRPFVAINCTSVADSLLESELFGHERGAFTGAVDARRGRFELAEDGTFFLDEIGDASPAFQAAILRTLQEGELTPLGGEKTRPVRARFIAATHRPLEARVREGTFRADLFYRIQVLELELLPLRERLSDLPEIAGYLLDRATGGGGKPPAEISAAAMERLLAHPWPGNVRELENVIERAVVDAGWKTIFPEHVAISEAKPAQASGSDRTSPGAHPPAELTGPSLHEAIRRHVEQVLERCGGNKREAARRLDISPGRLYRILEDEVADSD